MILIGIDDTDTLDTPGTNQLARRIAATLPSGYHATIILRHQLLFDPRIPYTSQNGSASIGVEADRTADPAALVAALRRELRASYVPGSDPGLCIAQALEQLPAEVLAFGRRCQREPVRQADAREIARRAGVLLEGFGGTEDGVIGALAAVGLSASGDDGRVVHRAGWSWPDGFTGAQPVPAIRARGVDEVRDARSGAVLADGTVDIGKHLRPSFRRGRVVLFVERSAPSWSAPPTAEWRALKLL
ncbi:MAG TPA: hypothetical protein VFU46_07940 [Gemmatimonadales bacterium]|nr:hypothetical protein [Gemmatimonadales bacterium]